MKEIKRVTDVYKGAAPECQGYKATRKGVDIRTAKTILMDSERKLQVRLEIAKKFDIELEEVTYMDALKYLMGVYGLGLGVGKIINFYNSKHRGNCSKRIISHFWLSICCYI